MISRSALGLGIGSGLEAVMMMVVVMVAIFWLIAKVKVARSERISSESIQK